MSVRKRIQADDPEELQKLEVARIMQFNSEHHKNVIEATLPGVVAVISAHSCSHERVVWSVFLRDVWSMCPLAEIEDADPDGSLNEAARFGEICVSKFLTFDPTNEFCIVFNCPGSDWRTSLGVEVPTHDQFWVIKRPVTTQA
jgi:hypothetical protein